MDYILALLTQNPWGFATVALFALYILGSFLIDRGEDHR